MGSKKLPNGIKRFFHIGAAIFQCFTTAGLVFGWVSLLPMLEKDGIYSEYCEPTETTCKAQDIRLHYAFTIAASSNMCANLFLGLVFDKFGPKACKVVSFICVLGGMVLIAFSNSRKNNPGFDLFLPGLSLLGFGGTGIQLGSVHMSNLFPAYKSAVACYLVGSFSLSFIIFFLFKEVYETFDIPRKTIFLSYTVIIVFNLILTLYVDPNKPYRLKGAGKKAAVPSGVIRLPSVFQKGKDSLFDSTPKMKKKKNKVETAPLLPKNGLIDRSFKTQLSSGSFIHLVIFFSIGTLWSNYLVGSLSSQIKQKENASKDFTMYMQYFNIILPGGVVAIPIIGHMLESCGYICSMFWTVMMGIFYSILLKFDSFWPLIAAFILYSVYRTFLFAIIFAYMGHTFGFRHFGVLSGILFLIAAIFDLLQTFITTISDFGLVTTIQMCSFMITFSLPLYEFYKSRQSSIN